MSKESEWFKNELFRLLFIKESDKNSIALDLLISSFEDLILKKLPGEKTSASNFFRDGE